MIPLRFGSTAPFVGVGDTEGDMSARTRPRGESVDAGREEAEVVGEVAVREVGDACAQDGDRLGGEGSCGARSAALTPSSPNSSPSRRASVSPSL
jgi:hypothetical protein